MWAPFSPLPYIPTTSESIPLGPSSTLSFTNMTTICDVNHTTRFQATAVNSFNK